jgi:hypothetical protein
MSTHEKHRTVEPLIALWQLLGSRPRAGRGIQNPCRFWGKGYYVPASARGLARIEQLAKPALGAWVFCAIDISDRWLCLANTGEFRKCQDPTLAPLRHEPAIDPEDTRASLKTADRILRRNWPQPLSVLMS